MPRTPPTRFAAATGFELQRDLQEIVVAEQLPSDARSDALIARPRHFSVRQSSRARDRNRREGLRLPRRVRDHAAAERDAKVFAFLDPSTLVIGTEPALRDVIDRRASGAVFAGPLLQKAKDASAAADAWFATVTPLTDMIPATSDGGIFNPATLLAKRDRNAGPDCISTTSA